jgi:hypothetical protein
MASGAEVPGLKRQIQELQSCNTDLIKLERRWRFQSQLASSIQDFLNMYKTNVSQNNMVQFNNLHVRDGGKVVVNQGQNKANGIGPGTTDLSVEKGFRALDSDTNFQRRLVTASEYDLSVLSRRIANQFTAVCASV